MAVAGGGATGDFAGAMLSAFGAMLSAFGVEAVVGVSVVMFVAIGMATVVSVSVKSGVMGSVKVGVQVGVTVGVVCGVLFGVAADVRGGVTVGVAAGAAYMFFFLSIPGTSLSIIVSAAERAYSAINRRRSRLVVVRWFDRHFLPIPGLQQEILDSAAVDPPLVRVALEACQRSPGCRKTGAIVLAILNAREWARLISTGDLSDAAKLRGTWLAGERETDVRMQRFAEVARSLRAASVSVVARQRLAHVKQAQD